MMASTRADRNPIRITRGELYAVVFGTFLLVAATVFFLNTRASEVRAFLATPAGAAAAVVGVGLIVLPATRILIRTYYGVEDAPAGKLILWTLLAAAVAAAIQWAFGALT